MNAKKMKMIRKAARGINPDGARTTYQMVPQSTAKKGYRPQEIRVSAKSQKAVIKKLKRDLS